MKKVAAAFLLVLAMAFSVPAQAQSDLDLNRDFKDILIPVSNIHGGVVVNIRTYLSIREYPSVNSRELARVPNGTQVSIRDNGVQHGDGNWFNVIVDINGRVIDGYANKAYIKWLW